MKVKLLLKEDVNKLGITGDVVEVASGYARNYLLPNGIAREINSSSVQEIEKAKKRRVVREVERKSGCEDLAKKLAGVELTIAARVSEAGTLYGGISPSAVADALGEQGIELSASIIKLPKIKALGDYEAQIHLHSEVDATCKVTIVEDDSEVEETDEIPDELSDMEMGDKNIDEAMEREMSRGRGGHRG